MKKAFGNNVNVVNDKIVEIELQNYDSLQFTTATIFNTAIVLFLTPTRWVKFSSFADQLIYTFDNIVHFSINAVSFVLNINKKGLKITVTFR